MFVQQTRCAARLLLVAAAYAFTRASEKASAWWLRVGRSGALAPDLGFLNEDAPSNLRSALACRSWRRSPNPHVASGNCLLRDRADQRLPGWWIATVELPVPAEHAPPCIGGSTKRISIMDTRCLGCDSLSRLANNRTSSVVPAACNWRGRQQR